MTDTGMSLKTDTGMTVTSKGNILFGNDDNDNEKKFNDDSDAVFEENTHESKVDDSLPIPNKKFGLHRDEIIPQFRIPYVITGYRRPNLNATECLHSAFLPNCNESINVWSHFIALMLFIVKFYTIFTTNYTLNDSSKWPLLSASLGICGFCLASTSAHMFNSMSPSAQHNCFFMDYAAIGVYSVGVGQAFFFYGRPIHDELYLFQSEWPFTVISAMTSITTTLLCCITRRRWHKYKYIIRTSSFVAPFLVNASPYLYRMAYCPNKLDCVSQDSLRVFNIHCVFYITAALVNMLRFPERVFPGKFDLFGHSHHFMHIFTAIGASYQFDAVHLDMSARQSALLQSPLQTNISNTLLPFAITVVVNFGIAIHFGKRTEKDKAKHKST